MNYILPIIFLILLSASGCKAKRNITKTPQTVVTEQVEPKAIEAKPEVKPLPARNEPPAGISFYPNPVKDMLMLSFHSSNTTKGAVKIFDLLGNEVHNSLMDVREGMNAIDVSMGKLKSGIYMIEAYSDGKKIGIKRVTKE
jgi:hypothetical protein